MEYEFGSIQVTTELQDNENEKINSLTDITRKYQFLREKPKEHFYAVFLKIDNEVIGDKLIGLGSTDKTPVDTKDIGRTAVLTNASGVILVHNHPSNNNTPSTEDIETTRKIKEGLKLFNIGVLDHVIITQDDHYSMKYHDDI